MYSLEQLRGFVAVAEELHFGRAAERLNMTQPPLSRQIQKLEHAISVQLFDRGNGKVALTPAGVAFLGEARRLLDLAHSAPDLARRISAGTTGAVRLGFTAASTYGLLGNILNTLSDALPDLDIELKEMVTQEQLGALAAGEIDLGLARPPFDPALFSHRLLSSEAMVAAVPTGHRFTALGRPVNGADLAQERLIMHSPTQARYFYDLVAGLVAGQHAFAHTVTQIQTMISLVAAGRGVALVPRSAAFLGIAGVEYTQVAGLPPAPAELHGIWLRAGKNPAVNRILDVLAGAASADA